MPETVIALAGNPNAGKTTIFNALTGLHQHTGNWPGKTVEKKEGEVETRDGIFHLVDLPGAYSLSAYSPEEVIARAYILEERPRAVINVLDASNLERNLYLTAQLLELETPVVLALNMMDDLQKNGASINTAELSRLLGGIPVLTTTANKGKGIQELAQKARRAAEQPAPAFQLDYGSKVEREIAKLIAAFDEIQFDAGKYPRRWLAIKLLEGDEEILSRVKEMPAGENLLARAERGAAHLRDMLGEDVDLITADRRYGFINGVTRQTLRRPQMDRITLTDRVDDVVTHKWFGLPIFFLVMYVMFRLVIDVSAPFLDWTDSVINGLFAHSAHALLDLIATPAWLHSLLVDGIVSGVGGVLVLVPGLLVLYFFLALLEDSGYMSRAAFVMDRFMRVVGLHGKSFIPMILGFGCAVPAVYATRTIPSLRDRILTALLVPLMSCSARLPVYVVFGIAFFGAQAGTVIWAMYALGILIAMLSGMVFTRTLLKPDVSSAFVLELPPYRTPAFKSVLIHMWENAQEFIRKAGTTILAASVIMWLLLNLPWGVSSQRDSYFGKLSGALAPVFAPLGFGNWEAGGALVGGFMAKEIVVSSLSQIYVGGAPQSAQQPNLPSELKQTAQGFVNAALRSGRILISILPGVDVTDAQGAAEDTALSAALRQRYTPLSAAAFLVFVLLYVPCVATLGALRQEFGLSWALTSAIYQTAVAWLAALVVFQGGRLLGFS